jgi:hypothetical protein
VKVLLDASWYLVALALGLAVCLLLLVTFTNPGEMQLGIPVTFEMTLRPDQPPVQPVAAKPPRIDKGSGTLIVPIDRGGFLYATVTTLIVLLAIGLWILGQLCAVLRTVRDGKPFTAANVRRIRWVGVTGILHGLIILAIAEVFRTGTRLDEDQSLTI